MTLNDIALYASVIISLASVAINVATVRMTRSLRGRSRHLKANCSHDWNALRSHAADGGFGRLQHDQVCRRCGSIRVYPPEVS